MLTLKKGYQYDPDYQQGANQTRGDGLSYLTQYLEIPSKNFSQAAPRGKKDAARRRSYGLSKSNSFHSFMDPPFNIRTPASL